MVSFVASRHVRNPCQCQRLAAAATFSNAWIVATSSITASVSSPRRCRTCARSAIGVWLTRGLAPRDRRARAASRTSSSTCSSRAPTTRSAEDIAQAIDSIGGQLDAFTAKEYASYYIKVLDEHLPLAVDILADIVLRPAFGADDIEREKKVILEEIKMVEDTPDDLVHELFTQGFWEGHPLGRPILGTQGDASSRSRRESLREYFRGAYVAPNLIVSAVGNLEHAQRARAGRARRSATLPADGEPLGEHGADGGAADRDPRQGARAEPRLPRHRAAIRRTTTIATSSYVLNTMLGGSMSSRLFQNVREKRGLAYAVFSGLSAYRDAGSFTIYAGCANEAVGEVIDLVRRGAARAEADAGAGRGAAAREGSPEGQPDAEPREHRRAACRTWRGRRSTSTGSSASTRRWPASSA